MKNDINRLVAPAPAAIRLPPAKPLDAIPTRTGLERQGGAGEVATHEITVASTDGLFSFTIKAIK